MSLARCPRTISLCCSSAAARSAASRVAKVTNAQCRVPMICAKEQDVSGTRPFSWLRKALRHSSLQKMQNVSVPSHQGNSKRKLQACIFDEEAYLYAGNLPEWIKLVSELLVLHLCRETAHIPEQPTNARIRNPSGMSWPKNIK